MPQVQQEIYILVMPGSIYNYLFAKKMGEVNSQVEDTDLERSKKEYEDSMVSNMKWLGVTFDEGLRTLVTMAIPSVRAKRNLSKTRRSTLREKAFYCFCTDEELEQMREGNPFRGEILFMMAHGETFHWKKQEKLRRSKGGYSI